MIQHCALKLSQVPPELWDARILAEHPEGLRQDLTVPQLRQKSRIVTVYFSFQCSAEDHRMPPCSLSGGIYVTNSF